MTGDLRVDLQVAVHEVPAVEDIGRTPCAEFLISRIGNVGVGVVAADVHRQALYGFSARRDPDPDPVLVIGFIGVLPSAWFAVVFHFDTEGHIDGLLAAGFGVRSGTREAGQVGRSLTRFGAADAVARIAQCSVERGHQGAAWRVAFAAADQAVEVGGLEAALLLLAGMFPVALDVVERIEAADAAAWRAYLAASGRLGDFEVAIEPTT